jgi:hypothetical protein
MPDHKANVVVKILPDGRVRIHWFIHDSEGPASTPGGSTATARGPIQWPAARGRIACQPKREHITAQYNNGKHYAFVYSDDARAATCPECKATAEYKAMMEQLGEILETAPLAAGGV